MTRAWARLLEFLRLESAAGILLIFAALTALIVSNSILAAGYTGLFATPIEVRVGAIEIAKPFLLWVNDGLMAIFFLLVGLEIKREVMEGELSTLSKAGLPLVAAIGGMIGPMVVYLSFNGLNSEATSGWAIPAATDIAFALAVLLMLGPRVPVALKVLLLAVAILDDLGAITIIALFYTDQLSTGALSLAAAIVAVMFLLNRARVTSMTPYLLLGLVLWVCVLKSGVHATLAGVVTAFMIPIRPRREGETSPLHKLEHDLHPWVAYMILPVFAFANAGVSLSGITMEALMSPITLGIAAGLFFGKQIGVFGATALVAATGLIRKPDGTNWLQIYGIACLTGIGFTMSLFIGNLAFTDAVIMDQVRIGVLAGSLAAALLGYSVLRVACAAPQEKNQTAVTQGAGA